MTPWQRDAEVIRAIILCVIGTFALVMAYRCF